MIFDKVVEKTTWKAHFYHNKHGDSGKSLRLASDEE